jgi:hypothetical protein
METVLIKESDVQMKAVTKHIPLCKHMVNALYMGMLSFFWRAYKSSVVTIGGKINLLGIVSFVMIILAVYTANLAAILPQEAQMAGVDSPEAALRMGYIFCVKRHIAPILLEMYRVNASRINPDPEAWFL